MSGYRVGSYVLHKKLQELGAGEVVMVDKGAIRIRFASGERSFAEQQVDPHLELTDEAPEAAAPAPSRKRTTARKAATKRAPAKAKAKTKIETPAPAPADDDE